MLAQSLGLPLLPPSKSKGKDFRRGANMAITGATAMNFSFYQSLGIEDPVWNHGSLYMQIQWFTELIPSLCGTKQSEQFDHYFFISNLAHIFLFVNTKI
jgi:hypothetical protein